MDFTVVKPKPYQGKVFRNIFTNASGLHILEGISAETDYSIIDAAIQITSGIDHMQPQFHRPFQYSDLEDEDILGVFNRENWNYGRFGDGKTYGVWYAAEDETTSVYESSWTAYRLAKDNVLPKKEVYATDRAMYSARIETLISLDLMGEEKYLSQLVHPTDYSFCQGLGRQIIDNNLEMLRTPSARRRSGVCTPLFSPVPIKEPQRIYYLKVQVYPDGWIGVNSSQEKMNFSVRVEDLEAPYVL